MAENEKTCEEKLKEQEEQIYHWHLKDKAMLLDVLRKRFGEEVLDLAEQQEGILAQQYWAGIAERHGSNTIEDLIKVLWEPTKAQGFEYTCEKQADGIQMKCTKCHWHDVAKEWKVTDIMYKLICCTDPFITEGFNPKIGFKRTKTLMEGHDCCDHFYYIKE